MDIDLSPLIEERALVQERPEKKETPKPKYPVPHTGGTKQVDEAHQEEDILPLDEAARRAERRRRRGVKVGAAFGEGGAYVYDLGEYRKKKVKVWVQYEGYGPTAIKAERRHRVAITLPANWVNEPVSRVKDTFVDVYNQRHETEKIDPNTSVLATTDDVSYLTFAKHIFADDASIGDSLHDHEELFVLTEEDVTALDAEIASYRKELSDLETAGIKYRTIDTDTALSISPLVENDASVFRVLLIGMHRALVIPFEPQYTIADLKAYIHFKVGPDLFPIGSLDMAHFDHEETALNVLPDSLTLLEFAQKLEPELDLASLPKPCVPVHWGKRLQDPRFFFYIPTLHTPESFRGPTELGGNAAASSSGDFGQGIF